MGPASAPTPADPSGSPEEPALTVVLPVLNEARDLGDLLDQLRGQDDGTGKLEVLVVDGGSTDDTPGVVAERAARWPALRLLGNPARRSGPGRNVGARAARGRYILFLDGHCQLPREDYIERTLRIFAESGADCLCRPQPLDRFTAGSWAAAVAAARHSPLGHNPGSDIYADSPGFTRPETAGAAYRREVFAALGGYDERFDACEDVEFNRRVAQAGFSAYRHPDLAVAYRPRETPLGLFRQMARYGRGRARLWARHPGLVPWPLIALTLALLGAIAAAILGGPAGRLAVGAGVLAYAIVCAVEARRRARAGLERVRTALVFPIIHAGLLAGFWRGLVDMPRYARPEPDATGGDRVPA